MTNSEDVTYMEETGTYEDTFLSTEEVNETELLDRYEALC